MKTMHDIVNWPDEKVFGGAGEQEGSQMSYWRTIEIQRRLYLLQKESVEAQIAATEEQRAAIQEMRFQSKMMLWAVIAAFLSAACTLVAAIIG